MAGLSGAFQLSLELRGLGGRGGGRPFEGLTQGGGPGGELLVAPDLGRQRLPAGRPRIVLASQPVGRPPFGVRGTRRLGVRAVKRARGYASIVRGAV